MDQIGSRLAPVLLLAITMAGCGGEEVGNPGTISAQISCEGQDSLIATIYITKAASTAASEWCACGAEPCSISFEGLGDGAYVLGLSRPDSLYRSSQGTEGFTQTLGYYGQGGLADAPDTIVLSEDQPSANIQFSLSDLPTFN